MDKDALLMGIDIGTSSCKVAVFDIDGKTVASADREYTIYCPKEGWVEQDCNEWYAAVSEAINECMDGIDENKLKGVGIAGQSWSCIPIDENGNVLYKTPIWMDVRAADICERYKKKVGEDRILSVAKNPFSPSYTTPKIIWFKENLPEVYEKTKYFLQSNSYIVYRLTGAISQDRSQCYGLHVYNIETEAYDTELCDELGIDIKKLPPICECDCVVGRVTGTAASETGLPEGIPVVAGGLDAACGTLGTGVYETGQTQEQGGQAGGMSICIDRPIGDPKLILGHHVIPGKWLLQGGTVAGSASYKWIAETIGESEFIKANETGMSPWKLMDDMAEDIEPGSEGLIFLPYLSGERSPIWDPDALGMFFGLSMNKGKGHLYRSVMEGVGYALRHNLEVADKAGVTVSELNSMGGASGSKTWMQIKSDITGKKINISKSDMATTLGAALLAGVGTGEFESYEEAVKATVRIERSYEPNFVNKAIYDRFFDVYLELYQSTKQLMKEVKNILNSK